MRLPNSFFLMIWLLLAPNMILAQDQPPEDAKAQQQDVEDTTDAVEGEIKEGGNRGPEGVDMPDAAIGLDLPGMVAAKRFQLNQVFAVEIEEIKRVCDLDDAQVTKLSVGAKGAVKKLTNEWGMIIGRGFGIMPIAEVDADGNEVVQNDEVQLVGETAEVEIADVDQIDEGSLQMMDMGNRGDPFSIRQPTNNEFWKKTLASTLSDSQSARLDQYRQDREKEKRAAMIETCLSTINLELGLTGEQQAKLSTLITPLLENAEINCPLIYESFVIYYYASKVDENSLREFLSNAQIQKWKFLMAPTRMFGRSIELAAQEAVIQQEADSEPIEIDDDP